MTQPEYEQKKRECWDTYIAKHGLEYAIPGEAFNFAFDRAYALGKQEKEEAEVLTCEKRKVLYHFRLAETGADGNHPESKYWIGYSQAIQNLFGLKGEPYVVSAVATVISAWIARDEDNDLFIYKRRPVREDGQPFSEKSIWAGGTLFQLDSGLFPNLTWESEPQRVEIIITSNHL